MTGWPLRVGGRTIHPPGRYAEGEAHQQKEARRNPLGSLAPQPGRQRASLLSLNAPEDTPLDTLACMGGSRWRIETEFETETGDVEMDEYETRSWAGWHHHIALCLLGGTFLLSLQQAWGKRCHGSPGRRCIGWCVRCCLGSGSDLGSCCSGWRIHNVATNAPASPMPSAALTFAYPQASLLEPSL